MDGTGTDALLLPELPVAEVSAVTVAGEEDESYSYALHDGPAAHWAPTGSVFATEAAWPKGRNNVETIATATPTLTSRARFGWSPCASRPVSISSRRASCSESLGQRSVRYEGDAGSLSTTDQIIIRKHAYKRQPSRVVVA